MARSSALLALALLAMAAGALADTIFEQPGQEQFMKLHNAINAGAEQALAPVVAMLDQYEPVHSQATRQAAQLGTVALLNAATTGNDIADAAVANGAVVAGHVADVANQIIARVDKSTDDIPGYADAIVDGVVVPLTQQADAAVDGLTKAVAGAATTGAKAFTGALGGATGAVGIDLANFQEGDIAAIVDNVTPLYRAGDAAVRAKLAPFAKHAAEGAGQVQLVVDGITRPIRGAVHAALGQAANAGVGALKGAVPQVAAGLAGLNGVAIPVTVNLANGAASLGQGAMDAGVKGVWQLVRLVNGTHNFAEGVRKQVHSAVDPMVDQVIGAVANKTAPLREAAMGALGNVNLQLQDTALDLGKAAMPTVNAGIATLVGTANDASTMIVDQVAKQVGAFQKSGPLPAPLKKFVPILERSANSGLATLQETLNNVANVANMAADNANKNFAAYQEKIDKPLAGALAAGISTYLKADNAVSTGVLKGALAVQRSVNKGITNAVRAGIQVHNDVQPRTIGGHAMPVVEIQADRVLPANKAA